MLGGHSLRAAQVAARAREAFGIELGITALFEQPTVAGLAERVGAGMDRTVRMRPGMIERVSRDGPLPLSLPQERVWFLEQLHPGTRAYVFHGQLRMKGTLDRSALDRSLSELVLRHEILHTTFRTIDGRPVQVIDPAWQVRVPLVDLESIPPDARDAELGRLIDQQLEIPVDVSRLPLVRWLLFRFGPEDHLLLQLEHHLLHDGWSFRLFLQELGTVYSALSRGHSWTLPELGIQFADFAAWQRAWLETPAAAAELEYWTANLADAPGALDLRTDRPRPPIETLDGASLRIELPSELVGALRHLAQDEGASLFMLLLAAFDSLLFRYTGQSDLLVGSGVANRSTRQAESLLGMLVNTVVLRTRVDGDRSFRDLLAQVRQTCLGAYRNQSLPLDRVVEELRPDRDPSRNPLFQVMFSFHDAPMPVPELPGLEVQVGEALSNGGAKFELNLIGIPDSPGTGELTVVWEYNTHLFDAATIARMAGQYRHLLESLVLNPDLPVSRLDLIGDEERQQLLGWGANPRPYPSDRSIHDLFSEQALRTPDAVALTCGEQQLTFCGLDRQANQVAQLLRQRGVCSESVVGVCLDRSVELIVAVLAVLKAGGAYLPLAVDDPAERIEFMLSESRATIVLSQAGILDRLPAAVSAICFDRDAQNIRAQSAAAPIDEWSGDRLAYIMYTSGSTGSPKGVLVPHRAVVRLVVGTDYVRLSADEVLLQLATPAFDASTFEIWGALLNGGRLVVYPSRKPSLAEVASILERQRVTTLWLTAGLFQEIVDYDPYSFAGVRQLLAGGDVLSPSHVRALGRAVPECLVINGYGPTENTTFTCCYPVKDPEALIGSVPIGSPIANTSVYVLDPNSQLVPIGVPGELYVGGDGLARGYLNAPELTAERFVADPFDAHCGGRLYRTGDQVRWLANGTLEFLGRRDQQLKIRGFRVEPAEIETALTGHPDVLECAVLDDLHLGHRRLVAYVVRASGSPAPDPATLREFLHERLPEYMLPSVFVDVERLPLTANGKVNRAALPSPGSAGAGTAARGHVAARTETEQRMAALWAEALGKRDVGVFDNFFELGGHSLLAARLFGRIHREFGVSLPLVSLFPNGTVAGLAELVTASRLQASSSLVELAPGGSLPPLFCIHPIDGDVLRFSLLARLLSHQRPVFGLRARGLEPGEVPHTSIETMATDYADLIQHAQLDGPYHLAGFSSGGVIAYEVARQLKARGLEVGMLGIIDAHAPLSAGAGWGRRLRQLPADLYWYAGYARRPDQRGKLVRRQLADIARGLVQLGRWLGGVRSAVDADAVMEQIIVEISAFSERHLSVARAHQRALEQYRPGAYGGRVSLVRAQVQLLLSDHDPLLGWDALASGGLEVSHVPGRHEEMFEQPHVHTLAIELARLLGRHLGNMPSVASRDY